MSYGYTASASPERGNAKFLRITDIVPAIVDWEAVPWCEIANVQQEKYSLQAGDIVVARTGATVGYAKRMNKHQPKAVFASYLVRLRVDLRAASNYALGIVMQSPEYKAFIQRNAGGAAQPNANAQVLTSMAIPVPPREVSKAFDCRVEALFDHMELLAIQRRNARRTRDLLLPRLLSGQLDVSEAE